MADREKNNFYEELEAKIDHILHRDNMIMLGDIISLVGVDRSGHKNIIGVYGIGDRNRYSERILDFCIRN